MSADNWTACPACLDKARRHSENLKQQVIDGYGKLPITEWDTLRAEAEKEVEIEQTFREDYEFWGAHEGTLHISYEGRCTVCGTGTKFEEVVKFWSPS